MAVKQTKLFINNEFVDAESGKTFETVNPSTEEVICQVAQADSADVDKAVAAAKKAFKLGSTWRTMDASKRGVLINRLADLIERDLDELAALETLNNGMTLAYAKTDVEKAVRYFRYSAGEADKIHGDTVPADGNVFSYTRKEPIGVVGQFVPCNYPILMVSWKLAPALAAGCTVVLKPADQTPLTALQIASLSKEAGFPDGVINVVTGVGPATGEAIAHHQDVRLVAFTGTSKVGKKLLNAAGDSNLKKVLLNLEGKSPYVVFEDADLDFAAQMCHKALFCNAGQTCCGGTRTFVHDSIYDKFVAKAKELAQNRKVGNPYEDDVEQGPVISKANFERVLDFIETGKKEGAKLECGGARLGDKGYFIQPTVFSDVKDHMTIAKEEIFGPVQSILKFSSVDDLVERANSTKYGLSAGIITNDLNKAIMFSQAVDAGLVWVNTFMHTPPQTPFGGMKESGNGPEGGPEGINQYLETKTVTIAIPQKNS